MACVQHGVLTSVDGETWASWSGPETTSLTHVALDGDDLVRLGTKGARQVGAKLLDVGSWVVGSELPDRLHMEGSSTDQVEESGLIRPDIEFPQAHPEAPVWQSMVRI